MIQWQGRDNLQSPKWRQAQPDTCGFNSPQNAAQWGVQFWICTISSPITVSDVSSLGTNQKVWPRPQCHDSSTDGGCLGIAFHYFPIINTLCPAVSVPVTQAPLFIRWCSATREQSDKIHSLQEVGGHILRCDKNQKTKKPSLGSVFHLVPLFCLFATPHAHKI